MNDAYAPAQIATRIEEGGVRKAALPLRTAMSTRARPIEGGGRRERGEGKKVGGGGGDYNYF